MDLPKWMRGRYLAFVVRTNAVTGDDSPLKSAGWNSRVGVPCDNLRAMKELLRELVAPYYVRDTKHHLHWFTGYQILDLYTGKLHESGSVENLFTPQEIDEMLKYIPPNKNEEMLEHEAMLAEKYKHVIAPTDEELEKADVEVQPEEYVRPEYPD